MNVIIEGTFIGFHMIMVVDQSLRHDNPWSETHGAKTREGKVEALTRSACKSLNQ